jgi:hypothetical protein
VLARGIASLRRASDRELAWLIGAVLFLGAALPLAFVRLPPYQDLQGHLATADIVSNLDEFPEFVFNGFSKTNSTLVAFACLLGKYIGIRQAGRLFVFLVLGVNAFVLPHFVLRFAGRERMLCASLFMAPMVHNWFVSMGMLNFSLSVSLSMLLLVALDHQRSRPSLATGVLIALLALGVWYAHQCPLMMVEILVAVHVLARRTWRDRWAAAGALGIPLLPATAVALANGVAHLRSVVPQAAPGEAMSFQTPLWLLYDLWGHWGYGYTPLSATSLFSMLVLAAYALRRGSPPRPFFGAWGIAVILTSYFAAPYSTIGLGYAGSRIIPFVWMAALLRAPPRLPSLLTGALVASTLLYFAGMGIDDVRLAKEQAEFAAGVDVVPRGAKLDVFVFSTRLASKNTWSLSTSWGEYVLARQAHTWEVWADSPSLPITRRTLPTPRLDPAAHRRFIDSMATRLAFCGARDGMGLDPEGCEAEWRAEWSTYWHDVDPYVDMLVMWDAPADALSQVPAAWRLSFARGHLRIFERPLRQKAKLDVDAAPGPAHGG